MHAAARHAVEHGGAYDSLAVVICLALLIIGTKLFGDWLGSQH